jgi:hypothetical protein
MSYTAEDLDLGCDNSDCPYDHSVVFVHPRRHEHAPTHPNADADASCTKNGLNTLLSAR